MKLLDLLNRPVKGLAAAAKASKFTSEEAQKLEAYLFDCRAALRRAESATKPVVAKSDYDERTHSHVVLVDGEILRMPRGQEDGLFSLEDDTPASTATPVRFRTSDAFKGFRDGERAADFVSRTLGRRRTIRPVAIAINREGLRDAAVEFLEELQRAWDRVRRTTLRRCQCPTCPISGGRWFQVRRGTTRAIDCVYCRRRFSKTTRWRYRSTTRKSPARPVSVP